MFQVLPSSAQQQRGQEWRAQDWQPGGQEESRIMVLVKAEWWKDWVRDNTGGDGDAKGHGCRLWVDQKMRPAGLAS